MFPKTIFKKITAGSLLFLLQSGQSCPIPHKNTTEFFIPSKEPAPEENRAVLVQEGDHPFYSGLFMFLLPSLLEAFHAREDDNRDRAVVSLIYIVTQEDQDAQTTIFHPFWG